MEAVPIAWLNLSRDFEKVDIPSLLVKPDGNPALLCFEVESLFFMTGARLKNVFDVEWGLCYK